MNHNGGWTVHDPRSLRKAPTKAEDLVQQVHLDFLADSDPPDVYDSSAKAWQVATEYLTEMQSQALVDIAYCSSPDYSTNCVKLANGVIRITHLTFAPGFVEGQIQEARDMLDIAEAGLALCPKHCG